jgi:hypothetical protein
MRFTASEVVSEGGRVAVRVSIYGGIENGLYLIALSFVRIQVLGILRHLVARWALEDDLTTQDTDRKTTINGARSRARIPLNGRLAPMTTSTLDGSPL